MGEMFFGKFEAADGLLYLLTGDLDCSAGNAFLQMFQPDERKSTVTFMTVLSTFRFNY